MYEITWQGLVFIYKYMYSFEAQESGTGVV